MEECTPQAILACYNNNILHYAQYIAYTSLYNILSLSPRNILEKEYSSRWNLLENLLTFIVFTLLHVHGHISIITPIGSSLGTPYYLPRYTTCWLWSLIMFLIQRSLLSAVFIPHEDFTPQKYVHSSTRGSAEGGYPLCGVRGAYPLGWGVRG
jgi:hypothetical protein